MPGTGGGNRHTGVEPAQDEEQARESQRADVRPRQRGQGVGQRRERGGGRGERFGGEGEQGAEAEQDPVELEDVVEAVGEEGPAGEGGGDGVGGCGGGGAAGREVGSGCEHLGGMFAVWVELGEALGRARRLWLAGIR